MADDLMDFSDKENQENLYIDDVDENAAPGLAPALLQSPVIVNSILKQNMKDNLIQLYTPVQKPVKGKLKVRFGSDSLLETPVVKGEKGCVRIPHKVKEESEKQKKQIVEDKKAQQQNEEEEEWIERTSVLTKQDHEEYTQIATEIIQELVTELPIPQTQNEEAAEEAEDISPMEISECAVPDEVQVKQEEGQQSSDEGPELSELDKLLLEAQECLKQYGIDEASTANSASSTAAQDAQPAQQIEEQAAVSEPVASHVDVGSAVEPMDCEEAMDVDDSSPIPEVTQMALPEIVVTEVKPTASQQQDVAEVPIQHIVENTTMSEGTSEIDDSDISSKPSTPLKQEAEPLKLAENKQISKPEERDQNEQTADTSERKTEKKEESSDEEFMSADEDVEETKQNKNADKDKDSVFVEETSKSPGKGDFDVSATKPDQSDSILEQDKVAPTTISNVLTNDSDAENITETQSNNTEEPVRSPPKKGYSLNFDDLDQMNPFATKSAICNSPDVGKVKASVQTPVDNVNNEQGCKNSEIISTEKDKTGAMEGKQQKINEEMGNKEADNCIQEELGQTEQNEPTELPIQTEETAQVKEKENQVITETQSTELTQEIQDNQDQNNHQKNSTPVETEAKASSVVNNFDEEIPISKGTYNLDDIDFENMDPFKPKKQMVNSPDLSNKSNNKTIQNSPKPITSQEKKPENIEDTPIKEGNKITAEKVEIPIDEESKSSINQQCKDSSESINSEQTSPTSQEEQLEVDIKPEEKQKAPVKLQANTNSLENIDPFKTNCKVAESPARSSELSQSHPKTLEEIDPFGTKCKVMNSPSKETNKNQPITDSLENIDPFKTTSKVANSPIMSTAKSETSPETAEDIDPFKVSNTIANSPDKSIQKKQDTLKNLDPFKTNSKCANSPVKADIESQTSQSAIEIQGLPDSLEEIDPFKTTAKVANSPVVKPQKENQSVPDTLDDIDPFKTVSKVASSPDKNLTTSQPSSNSLDDIDPFKTNTKIENSPAKPNGKESQSVSDSVENTSPFKTVNKVSNSPDKTAVHSQAFTDSLSDIDPFQTNSKIACSPAKTSGEQSAVPIVKADKTSSCTTEAENSDKLNSAAASGINLLDDEHEELEIQGVARRGEQPVGANIQEFQNCLDFDESQFVPASEVFRDPGVWDMLEQFGNTGSATEESSLSRMSLYVKFDPLVEAASSNPRRISIKPSQLEKVKEYGLDETLLLLGTPPKKRRQSMNVSHRTTPAEGKNASQPVKSKLAEAVSGQSKGVDLILEFSPSKESKQIQIDPLPDFALFPSGMSGKCDFAEEEKDTELLQELKYTDADLRRLRSEHKLEVQGILLAKGSEWQKEKAELNDAIKAEQSKVQALNEERNKLKELFVMFETTISELASKKAKADEEVEKIKKERDQAMQDTAAVENAFSDLHRRYEKMKDVLVTMKQNEEVLKKSVAEHLEKKKTMDTSFHSLKKKAEEKISQLSQEIKKLQKEKAEEKSSLEAKIKILTMQAESSAKTIQQKIAENKQLTEICENLISKHENGT